MNEWNPVICKARQYDSEEAWKVFFAICVLFLAFWHHLKLVFKYYYLFITCYFSVSFLSSHIFLSILNHFLPSLPNIFLKCRLFTEAEKTLRWWYSSSRSTQSWLCGITFQAHSCTSLSFLVFFLILAAKQYLWRAAFKEEHQHSQSFLSASTLSRLTDVARCCRGNKSKTASVKCSLEKWRAVIRSWKEEVSFAFLMLPQCAGISPNQSHSGTDGAVFKELILPTTNSSLSCSHFSEGRNRDSGSSSPWLKLWSAADGKTSSVFVFGEEAAVTNCITAIHTLLSGVAADKVPFST